MNFFKIFSLGLLAACGTCSLGALELDNQLDLSGGYRNDQISMHNTITSPDGFQVVDRFRVENADLGIVGFNFRVVMPMTESCCKYPFLNNFYAEGNAYWGWSGKDDFERVTGDRLAQRNSEASFVSQGKQRVRTVDFQIGLGYLLLSCDYWGLGMTGGYAYDWQHIRTGSGKTAVNAGPYTKDPLYDRLTIKQRWQGPWVGGDLFYVGYCDTLINLGYEYHFAHYHAEFNIPNNETARSEDFSDKRKSSKGYGNVVYLSAHTPFCDCWNVGLGVTYKLFRSRRCHMEPKDSSFESQGLAEGTKGKANAKWATYSIVADIGYSF